MVQEIHVKTGDKLAVGARIFTVEAEGGASQPAAAAQAAQAASNDSAPAASASSDSAAQQVAAEKGTAVGEPQAVAPSAASNDGYTAHTAPGIAGGGNGSAPGGASGGVSGNGSGGSGVTAASVAATPVAARSGATVPAAPSVRRLARELGVDIAQVPGSGPSGRISFADVKNFLQRAMPAAAPSGNGVVAMPLPDFSKWGEVERQPMSGIRSATAAQMARSWSTVPHVTQFDRADITELEKLRKAFAKKVEAKGGKLTVTAIALKVVASALKTFPQFNASVDMAAQEIVLKKYVHIGVAVDTDWGLLVPVIRDVDKKNIGELSAELTQLGEKARARKISLDDMQGGGFTITNLGGIGGTSFTPIVNTPEVAILGLARGTVEPVWNAETETFAPRTMLPLSLSYDHRVIDGADGARFLRWIAQALEQPFLLSLEG